MLYGITTFAIFFRLFASRAWWGLCLPIGAAGTIALSFFTMSRTDQKLAVMSAGFALRIVMDVYPNSLAIYLCSALFILLAPTAFLAFNYILYGRFVVNCIQRRHSLLKPERTKRYFIISDVTAFLVQVRLPFFPLSHFLMSECRAREVPF